VLFIPSDESQELFAEVVFAVTVVHILVLHTASDLTPLTYPARSRLISLIAFPPCPLSPCLL
jgi:hypothetical protein